MSKSLDEESSRQGDGDSHPVAESTALGLVAAAATGLAGIEPSASVALAGLAAAAGPWVTIIVNAVRTRFSNAERAINEGARHEQIPIEELVERAASDPFRQQLSAEAIEAAMRSALDAKIVALGRAMAHGVTQSDAVAAQERQVIQSLARLELPHIRVLELAARDYRDSPFGSTAIMTGWTNAMVARHLPEYEALTDQLVAVLVSEGLVADLNPGAINAFAPPGQYGATRAGHDLLGRLREAGLQG